MIKVILIDDEPLITHALHKDMPWEKFDCFVCGVAENGEDGIELIEKHKPDIIITDIVIPKKSGLQIAEYCSKKHSECKIIILSAHSDFKYAQKALEYGVSQYVLKPIDYSKLEQSIVKLCDEIKKEKQIKKDVEKLRTTAENSTERASVSLLFDMARYGDSLTKQEKELILQIHNFKPSVVVSMCVYNIKKNNLNDLIVNYRNEFLNELNKQNIKYLSSKTQYGIVVLCELENGIDKQIAYQRQLQMLNKYKDVIYNKDEIAVFSISDVYNDFGTLHINYTKCIAMQKLGFFCDRHSLLTGQTLPIKNIENFNYIEDVLHNIRHGNINSLNNIMPQWKTYLHNLQDEERADFALREAYRLVSLEATKAGMRQKPVYNSETANENCTSKFNTVFHFATEVCTCFAQNNNLSDKMKLLIDTNYNSCDLNLTFLSEKLNVNSSYLSRLFKKSTGQNFSEYLLQLRLEKAKHLLCTTKMKNSQIANAVGFEDDHYFGQVFKKKCLVTPREFREMNENQ